LSICWCFVVVHLPGSVVLNEQKEKRDEGKKEGGKKKGRGRKREREKVRKSEWKEGVR